MNKIWIVGASGRVGEALKKELNTIENELLCTDFEDVDISDFESVETYAVMYRPNIIINCARISDEEKCEKNPDEAYKVHALGARNLAVLADRLGAKYVQMSTDDVFGGNLIGSNNEFDIPNPTTVYGKSRYAGERFVEEILSKFYIIRSSWVYGIGGDYVDYICEMLEKGESIESNMNQISVPTPSSEIARIVSELIHTEKYGIYHVVPQGACTRYELAKEIAKLKGYEESCIVPLQGPQLNTLLDAMMLRINNIEGMGDWRIYLKEYIEETGGRI